MCAGALLVFCGTMFSETKLNRSCQVPTTRTRTKVTKAGRWRRSPNLRRSKVPLSRRFLFESVLPQLCSHSPVCYARRPNLAFGYDLIRSRKLVSFRTSIPDAFESMFQVSMGRAAPSSAEAGKLVRRRRTKLRRFEVHRATLACFCDDCARGVGSIRHVRFPSVGDVVHPNVDDRHR